MSGLQFSEEDFENLSDWLMRRDRGIFDIVELEGFLTAIVIGPNTLSPLRWLAKVWGGKQPKFKDTEELNRFVARVMGYYNSIAASFESDPGGFEPTFYESKVDGKSVIVVDEWCAGFVKGMRLDLPGWKPLKRERPDLLKLIELFGTRTGWGESRPAAKSRCTRPGRRALHRRCGKFTRFGYRTDGKSSRPADVVRID